ncbi:hypothetical protein [Nonomuraea typhae]|uniref:Uncharacterized protein n=1 Tax=Nonomuraea typhae TaxID=2603600 RepID=A0ABW7YMR2_9ACTN
MYDRLVSADFEVAQDGDARLAAVGALGELSRQLVAKLCDEGREICTADFKICYVGTTGEGCSAERARGGTVYLKARTQRQTRRKSVLPGPEPLPDLATILAMYSI